MNKEMEKFISDALIFPKELHLESSSRCNSTCIMCPRENLTRFQGEMSYDIFKKAIDEATIYQQRIEMIHLQLNGEPLMMDIDDLVQRINYAKEKCSHPKICFFTNGSLLDQKKADKILNSNLDNIVFSVDGGNKEDYEKIRKLNWETVVNNIKTFIELRAKRALPKIQVAIVPQKANEKSINLFFELFKKLGADEVGGSGVQNIGGLIDSEAMKLPAQYDKGDINAPCWRIFNDLDIMADGYASICCQDVRGNLLAGNFNVQSLFEIWCGKVMAEVRQKFLLGEKNKILFCKDCDYMRGFTELPVWWGGGN